jgi:hypothetical protein
MSLITGISNIYCARMVGNVRYHMKMPNQSSINNWCQQFQFENKKMISISPGGFKGFYMWGISSYIKEHYDLSDYIFSGASAGAWNALLMCYKKDHNQILNKLFEIENDIKKKDINIFKIENILKEKILSISTDDDFDLHKLFIGASTFEKLHFTVNIFSDFANLEDAIDCCISSSHIPFITGGLLNRYHNMYLFDGGFTRNPYMHLLKTDLHITPDLWIKKKRSFSLHLEDYTTLFSKDKINIRDSYLQGYNDSHKNKDFLDKIFLSQIN